MTALDLFPPHHTLTGTQKEHGGDVLVSILMLDVLPGRCQGSKSPHDMFVN